MASKNPIKIDDRRSIDTSFPTFFEIMTGLGAKEIGQTDTGTIEKGKRADLLILSKDVISSPDLFDTPKTLLEVIKDGEGYKGYLKEIPQRTFSTHLKSVLESEKKPF